MVDNKVNETDILNCLSNLSNDEVFTSPEIVNKMLDLLPQELFRSKNTKFLDPCTKSGVFLREIVKRLIIGLESQIPNLQKRVNWILKNQVFGIPLTELTYHMSKRSLYCSIHVNGKYSVTNSFNKKQISGNICPKIGKHIFVDDKCVLCGCASEEVQGKVEQHAYYFIHCKKPEEIFNMKFDVIIGNPPYQLNTAGDDNGAQAKPIYQLFINQALKLKPRYLSMIIPSRWFAGGWGLDKFRDNMMSSNHIRQIDDFPNSEECFAGVKIAGGVNYFLYDESYNGKCLFVEHSGSDSTSTKRFLKEKKCDVVIRYHALVDVYNKVLEVEKNHFVSFSTIVSGRSPFGFNTNHTGEKAKASQYHIPYLQSKGELLYMDKRKVTRAYNAIDLPKVFISKVYGLPFPFPSQIINKPIIGKPGEICSGTYLLVGPFSNENEASNVRDYLCTKFVRALVLINKVSQDAYSKVYACVPMQDFSIRWDDEKLYKKYKLTKEEIDFIETNIKSM